MKRFLAILLVLGMVLGVSFAQEIKKGGLAEAYEKRLAELAALDTEKKAAIELTAARAEVLKIQGLLDIINPLDAARKITAPSELKGQSYSKKVNWLSEQEKVSRERKKLMMKTMDALLEVIGANDARYFKIAFMVGSPKGNEYTGVDYDRAYRGARWNAEVRSNQHYLEETKAAEREIEKILLRTEKLVFICRIPEGLADEFLAEASALYVALDAGRQTEFTQATQKMVSRVGAIKRERKTYGFTVDELKEELRSFDQTPENFRLKALSMISQEGLKRGLWVPTDFPGLELRLHDKELWIRADPKLWDSAKEANLGKLEGEPTVFYYSSVSKGLQIGNRAQVSLNKDGVLHAGIWGEEEKQVKFKKR